MYRPYYQKNTDQKLVYIKRVAHKYIKEAMPHNLYPVINKK